MSLISIILILSSISATTAAGNLVEFTCPSGWDLIGTHCYYFVNTDLDFNSAQEACMDYGAYLVSIRDETEGKDVADKAKTYFTRDSFWIANYRDDAPMDRDPMSGGGDGPIDESPIGLFGFWQANEPANYSMYGPSMMKSSAVSSDMEGRWKISPTEQILPFVCRVPACPKDTFRCNDGKCIRDDLKCDMKPDCEDGLDESDCGGCLQFYKSDSGSLTLDNYDNNAYCKWIIEAAPSKVLKIEFSKLTLENDVDVLLIYAGGRTRETSYLVKKVTGNATKDGIVSFYSSNNFFWLEFFSDSSIRAQGINVDWYPVSVLERGVVTTKVVQDDFVEITTPFFDNDEIPPFMTTEWNLTADPGELIVLEVLSKVKRDLIVVSEIGTEIDIHDGHRFAVVSKGNELRLVVKTEKMYNRKFKARFKKGCSIDLMASFAKISVRDMPKDNTCFWNLTNPDDLRFKAVGHVVDFHDNRESFLMIFDGSSWTMDNILFQGNRSEEITSPTILGRSTGNFMQLKYFSHRDSQMPDEIEIMVTSLCSPFPDESHLTKSEPGNETMTYYYISISCDQGYNFLQEEYHPDMKVMCSPSGKWMFGKPSYTRFPSCQIVYCGIPPQIENGFVQGHGGNVTYLGTVDYGCANGFMMDGEATVVCQDNGNWSTTPSCIAGSCPSFGEIMESSFEYLNGEVSSTFGTIIEITCDEGFELVGAKRVVCTNQTWSSSNTYCKQKSCPLPEVYKGSFDTDENVLFGNTVTLTCADGFQVKDMNTKTVELTCGADRLFEGSMECVDKDECLEEPCEKNEVCTNFVGYYDCLCKPGHNGTDCTEIVANPHTHCTFSDDGSEPSCPCNEGYELFTMNGQNGFYIASMETGVRDGDRYRLNRTCVPKVCSLPDMESDTSGLKSSKTQHYVGDFVEYFCPPHQTLDGPSTIECLPSVTFDTSSTTCEAISCNVPEPSRLEVSRTLTGAQLMGGTGANITCMDERSGSMKTRHIFCASNGDGSNYTLGGDDPTCPEIDCGPIIFPGRDMASNMITNSSLGGLADIVCDEARGFTLNGEGPVVGKARCAENGHWDYGTMFCQGARCRDPGTRAGTIQHAPNGYEMDQVVTYECEDNSFSLMTTGTLTCVYDSESSTAKWDNPPPICVDQEPPVINCPTSFELDLYDILEYTSVTAEDNSGYVRLVQHKGPRNMDVRIEKTTEFEFEAFDHNSSTSCNFTVSVRDRTYPSLTCPDGPVIVEYTEMDGTYMVNLQLDNFTGVVTDAVDVTLSKQGVNYVSPGQNIPVRITATKANGLSKECGFIVAVEPMPCTNKSIENIDNGRISNCGMVGSDYSCQVTCNPGYVLPSYVTSETANCLNSLWSKPLSYYNCFEHTPLIQTFKGEIFYAYTITIPVTEAQVCKDAKIDSLTTHIAGLTSVCGAYSFEMTDAMFEDKGLGEFSVEFTLKIDNYDDNNTALEECKQKLLNGKATYFESQEPNTEETQVCHFPYTVKTDDREKLISNAPSCQTGHKEIDVSGSSRCIDCPPGSYWDGADCSLCAKGYYKPSSGPQTCSLCPNTGNGIIVDLGEKGTMLADECVELCPEGFISNTGVVADQCKACPEDEYWAAPNSCQPCVAGSTVGLEAATLQSQCKDPCPAGQYSITGYAGCQNCPVNFYNAMSAQTNCTQCQEDQYTDGTGKMADSQCLNVTCLTDCNPAGTLSGVDCIMEYFSPWCPCKEGYTGQRCETHEDPCDAKPCHNGGKCLANGTSYTCDCPQRSSCSLDSINNLKYDDRDGYATVSNLDACKQLCLDNDDCKAIIYEVSDNSVKFCHTFTMVSLDDEPNDHHSFKKNCTTIKVLDGDYCEEDLEDDCTESSCAEMDFCRDLVGETECVCPTSRTYIPGRCEQPDKVCDAADCGEHGNCTAFGNVRFICECEPGFTGDSCETNIDDCEEVPCLHGGECRDQENGYTCNCLKGFSGNNCEHIDDLCETTDCLDGSCRMDYFTMTAICLCPDHYQWPSDDEKDSCTPIKYCKSSPCQNGATCNDMVGKFECECPSGFTGSLCQHNIDDCKDNSCENQGVCHDGLDGAFTCDCPQGFEGPQCQININNCADKCVDGKYESCEDLPHDFICHCKDGYTGHDCSETINMCDEQPCQHGGTCTNGFNSYECDCPEGWEGTDCENPVDYCSQNDPCVNKATCINMPYGTYCRCEEGTAGENCEIKSNLCDLFGDSLCLNGNCKEEGGSAKCECIGAVTTCDLIPSPYLSYSSAQLTEGYTTIKLSNEDCDRACEQREACKGLLISAGFCILLKAIELDDAPHAFVHARMKRCDLDPYYTGNACELQRDHCKDNPCGAHHDFGFCKIANLSYTCDCQEVENFEGPQCKTPVDVCDDSKCPVSIKCYPYMNDQGLITPACLCPASQVLAGSICKHVDRDYDLAFPMEKKEGSFVTSTQGFYIKDEVEITLAFWVACVEEPEDWIVSIADSRQDPHSPDYKPILKVMNSQVFLYSNGTNDTIPLGTDLSEGFRWRFVGISINAIGKHTTVQDYISEDFDEDLDFRLPKDRYYFVHIGKGFHGYISQVSVWKSTLSVENLVDIYLNKLDVPSPSTLALGWILYTRHEDVQAVRPSSAGLVAGSPNHVCQITRSIATPDRCPDNSLSDREPPHLTGTCYEEKTLSTGTSNQVTIESLMYEFNEGITASNMPDNAMTFGAHDVAVTATDGSGNVAVCMSRVYVTNNDCSDYPETTIETDDPLVRKVACSGVTKPSTPLPLYMSCGKLGSYNLVDPFREPVAISCGLVEPLRVTVTTFFVYATLIPCNTEIKGQLATFLNETLKAMTDLEWHLCLSEDCDNADITPQCNEDDNFNVDITIVLHDLQSMLQSSLSISILRLTPAEIMERLVDNGDFEATSIANARVQRNTFNTGSRLNCISGYGRQGNQCIQCGFGTRYVKDKEKCEKCPIGEYSDGYGRSECKVCTDGKTTLHKGSQDENDCVVTCYQGTYFNVTTTSCEPCPQDFYQDEMGQTYCKPCGPATGTDGTGSMSDEDCVGFCEAGTELIDHDCSPCERGFYRVGNVQDRCKECPEGTTTVDTSSTSESECNVPKCPPGSFIDQSVTPATCTVCDYGSYQSDHDQFMCDSCDETFTTANAGSTSESDCKFYCPAGQQIVMGEGNMCEDCPRRFYRGGSLAERFSNCTVCPDSSYTTADSGMISVDNCTVARCFAGTFYNASENSCDPCPKGTYQDLEQQDSCTSCDENYDTIDTGSESSGDCEFYCPPGKQVDGPSSCQSCPRGFYKSADMQFDDCQECPINTTDDEGSISESLCNVPICDAGNVVSPDGQCMSCPIDTYQPMATPYRSTKCMDCDENTGTMTEGNSQEDSCIRVCIPGQGKSDGNCHTCARGTWNNGNETMRFQPCYSCTDGFTTDKATGGSTAAECSIPQCDKGFILSDDKATCEECPIDNYQPIDHPFSETTCSPCDANTGTLETGADSDTLCKPFCIPGQGFNMAENKCEICVRGTWNNGNNSMRFDPCMECPEGYTTTVESAATALAQCDLRDCPPGKFFDADDDCIDCAIGFYQPEPRQSVCEQCPANKNTSSTGSDSSTDCLIYCPAGEEDDGTENCEKCAADFYKPAASFAECQQCEGDVTSDANRRDCTETFCDVGHTLNGSSCVDCSMKSFKSTRGNDACSPCPSNFTTDGEGSTAIDDCSVVDCEPGFTLPAGEDLCQPCDIGFYKTTYGNSACTQCEGDFTTDGLASTLSSQCMLPICDPGQYRLGNNCEDCAIGYYQTMSGQTSCEQCLEGYTTLSVKSTLEDDCRKICLAGQFRVEATNTCDDCEKGYYQPSEGTAACLECPSNFTTPQKGAIYESDCTIVCPLGYYGTSRTQCTPCEKGQFQNETGQTSCHMCPMFGSYQGDTIGLASSSLDYCLPLCTQGRYLHMDSKECHECSVGTYKGTIDLTTKCQDCPTGRTTLTTAATSKDECTYALCSKGYYRKPNEQECKKCDHGSYQEDDESQEASCTSCTGGDTTLVKGATGPEYCVENCGDGYEYDYDNENCRKCKTGSFRDASDPNQLRCYRCPRGKTTIEDGASSCIDTTVPPAPVAKIKLVINMNFFLSSCSNQAHKESVIRNIIRARFVRLTLRFIGRLCGLLSCNDLVFTFPRPCALRPGRGKRSDNELPVNIQLDDVDSELNDNQANDLAQDTQSVIEDGLRDSTEDIAELETNGLVQDPSSVTVTTSCVAGSIRPSADASCVPCPAGQYHDIVNNECKEVPKGSYTDAAGQTSPQTCPDGKTTSTIGSTSKSDCKGECFFNNNYCVNGECVLVNGDSVCRCKDYYKGVNCAEPTGEDRSNNDNITMIIAICVGISVLLFIFLILACLLSRHMKRKSRKSKRSRSDTESDTIVYHSDDYAKTPVFINPTFGGYPTMQTIQDPSMYHSNQVYHPVYGQQYVEG